MSDNEWKANDMISKTFDLETFVSQARALGSDTQRVEVKAAAGGLPKDVVETLSAFANTSGGVIVCGLSEQDGFSPAPGFDAARISAALAQACSDRMEPPVRATVEVATFEGAPVVVAHVPETEPHLKPCYVRARPIYDGSFVRVGDGDRRLSRYEVDRLLAERTQPTFDGRIVREASMSELDEGLTQGLLRRERTNSPRLFAQLSDEDALLSMGIAVADEQGTLRPTVAGLLALGGYPQRHLPRASVSFAVFPGTDKGGLTSLGGRILDARTIEGPVPIMVAETLASVRRNMRYTSRVEGAGRVDEPEYPEVAVREAVANALMHRDYSPEGCSSPVQVSLFSDRLEIVSPGGLYGTVTVDNIGTYGASSSRNARLSRVLEGTPYPPGYVEIGYVVENKGMGFAQMQAALQARGMSPAEPVDDVSHFVLTMRKGTATLGGVTKTGMTRADTIRVLLRERGSVSTTEVARALGVSSATARREVSKLVATGDVRRAEGTAGRSARYVAP